LVDEAINSKLFWAYCHMVDFAVEVFEKLTHWAESCPCHYTETPFKGPRRWAARRFHGVTKKIVDCPLVGMHAMELAANFLVRFIQTLLDRFNVELILRPEILMLNEEDRRFVMLEFARLRRHINFILAVKTGHWRQLPWVLFGLAHWDRDKATECANRAMMLYASAGDEARLHWLVAMLCIPGSVGWQQLQAFREGADLEEMPLLESVVARMFFAFVVERWIESRHAIMGRWYRNTYNASALHYAFMASLTALTDLTYQHMEGLSLQSLI
jgi:hypothetical protein